MKKSYIKHSIHIDDNRVTFTKYADGTIDIILPKGIDAHIICMDEGKYDIGPDICFDTRSIIDGVNADAKEDYEIEHPVLKVRKDRLNPDKYQIKVRCKSCNNAIGYLMNIGSGWAGKLYTIYVNDTIECFYAKDFDIISIKERK